MIKKDFELYWITANGDEELIMHGRTQKRAIDYAKKLIEKDDKKVKTGAGFLLYECIYDIVILISKKLIWEKTIKRANNA